MKLTPLDALRALSLSPAPYSIYAINRLREHDKSITQYHVRKALTQAEANGWCLRCKLKRSYGYYWQITSAGRAALSDEVTR